MNGENLFNMARTRARSSSGRFLPATVVSPAPIVVTSRARAPSRRRASKKRRHRRAARGTFGLGGIVGHAIGGAVFGFVVKEGWIDKLPAIPVVGRTGTAAIVLNEMAKRGMMSQLTRPAATAAAVLAGYQLGSTGSIHGEDENWPTPGGEEGY